MKLMTLNIWGGHVHKPLLDFIQTHQDTDIFCLQEVYHNAKSKVSTEDRAVSLNIFSDLQELLPDHQAFFRPVVNNVYGIGMLVKKNLKVSGEGEVTIYENNNYPGLGPTHSRILQWLECESNHQTYTIMNVHGLWNGKGKNDSPERITQAQKIREFVENTASAKILCGDFNLRPETESIKIIESGMTNLITDYNILHTRSSLYPRRAEEQFADYVFTCPKVTVNNFAVFNDEVSDHLPLMLDFC